VLAVGGTDLFINVGEAEGGLSTSEQTPEEEEHDENFASV